MKTFTASMQTHLEQVQTSLTTCIAVYRLDGVSLFVTAFNRDLTIEGGSPIGSPADVYQALGFQRTDVTAENNLDVGTTEVTSFLDSNSITEDDIRVGLWDFASYEVFQVNWQDLTMGRIQVVNGNLGTCRSGRIKFVAELLSLMQAVQNSIGALNSALCLHNFGANEGGFGRGNGCTFDVSTVTDTGTIQSVDSDLYGVHDATRVEVDAYYSNGKFRITSGLRYGMEFEIRAYIVGFWILFTALPEDLSGETYEIVRGCNKSRRQCIDDFNNIEDRLASDYTQGSDAAVQVGRHSG